MMDKLKTMEFPETLQITKTPKPSDWNLFPLGKSHDFSIIYNPPIGMVPNAFHRFMGMLFFGVVWEKKK